MPTPNMNDPFDEGGDGQPLNEEAFWQDLHATFETALDLLREIAEAHGIDPAAANAAEVKERERRLDEAARTHPLSVAASEYAQYVNRWFRQANDRINEWGEEAARAAELSAVSTQLQADVSAVQNAVEEIAAQRHRIHVKLMRALRERLRTGMVPASSMNDPALAAGEAYDGVTRSMDMWVRLRDVFPEEEDAILNLLVHLEQLREAIDGAFPAIHDPDA